ncbi:MAG: putative metalloprotease CJM1_0395 family protein [Betaproteobacteria bacterium]
MVAGVTQVPNLGFDRLFPLPSREQRHAAASTTKSNPSDAQQGTAANALTLDQQRQIDTLAAIDRKVKAHEQAHLSVGADLVRGGPNYSYQTGPDGKRYAVAGEVQIDTSQARKPEDTIPKAQHIRATALAPADPSSQDRGVAAQASSMEMAARRELALQMREQRSAGDVAVATYRAVADGVADSPRFAVYA